MRACSLFSGAAARRAAAASSAFVAPRAFSAMAFASTKLFSKSHEWVQWDEATKTAVVGLSDYAVNSLKDITYIDLPATGTEVTQDGAICQIESVKAVVFFNSPVNGTVSEVNGAYAEAENLAKLKNGGAEQEAGWIVKLSGVSGDKSALMTADEFKKFCDSEEAH
jgi:glycine cleavage system H protein